MFPFFEVPSDVFESLSQRDRDNIVALLFQEGWSEIRTSIGAKTKYVFSHKDFENVAEIYCKSQSEYVPLLMEVWFDSSCSDPLLMNSVEAKSNMLKVIFLSMAKNDVVLFDKFMHRLEKAVGDLDFMSNHKSGRISFLSSNDMKREVVSPLPKEKGRRWSGVSPISVLEFACLLENDIFLSKLLSFGVKPIPANRAAGSLEIVSLMSGSPASGQMVLSLLERDAKTTGCLLPDILSQATIDQDKTVLELLLTSFPEKTMAIKDALSEYRHNEKCRELLSTLSPEKKSVLETVFLHKSDVPSRKAGKGL